MYAIVEDGAHQYKVEEGQTLEIQLHDLDEGQDKLELGNVLLISDGENVDVGQPYVEGARVTATVVREIKGDKIRIVKYRRRKGYRRKTGHRQRYLRIHVDTIEK